jgi:hypothetical protein
MLAGLSRFLVQHERCGAGFDVAHPAGLGSGRVSITCRGCGARHEYATATVEIEREVRIEPARPAPPVEPGATQPQDVEAPPGPAAEIPPRPAPYPDMERRRTPAAPPAERPREQPAPARRRPAAARRARPRPHLARIAVALIAIAAVVVGLVALLDGGGEPDTPAGRQAPSPPPAAAPTPEATGPVDSPVPGTTQPPTATLRTERFTIEVPQGWEESMADGGLLLEPRGGGRVQVQVFYERSPGLTSTQMAQQTSDFLGRDVPGAALFPNRVQIAGQSAYELTARGPGETAIAVNVLRGPYRFLLVRRIFAGAKPQTSQAAGRVVLSFSPR